MSNFLMRKYSVDQSGRSCPGIGKLSFAKISSTPSSSDFPPVSRCSNVRKYRSTIQSEIEQLVFNATCFFTCGECFSLSSNTDPLFSLSQRSICPS